MNYFVVMGNDLIINGRYITKYAYNVVKVVTEMFPLLAVLTNLRKNSDKLGHNSPPLG
jgi:hypothetical protein